MSKKKSNKATNKLEPLNKKQEQLIAAILHNDMVVTEGSAGTGKTYIVTTMAAEGLKDGTYKRIIFTRPVIPCGKSIGFLPGTLEEKMAAWTLPFMAIIKQHFSQGEIDMFIKNEKIAAIPFEVMRGSSFDDSFIIMDEAQNCSKHEMKMFLTRIGEYSKTLILGDSTQSDLHYEGENGLEMVKRMIYEQGLNVPVVTFKAADIVRSGICKEWVLAFEKEGSAFRDQKELPDFITKPVTQSS